VMPGLSQKEIIEQSSSFVFRDGRVITFNDEVACSVDCCLKIEGAAVAQPLIALLQKLTEDELDVSMTTGEGDGKELLIRTGKKKSGIRMDQQVLLPIEGVEIPKKWKTLPGNFSEAIRIVQQCASGDESMFVLTCVHLHPEYVEACDQFQAARYPIVLGLTDSTLVRRSALKSVMGMDVTEIAQTENWLHFRNPTGLTLSCRRYVETYPALEKFLVVEGGHKTMLPGGLDGIVEKASIFTSNDDYNLVTVELRKGGMRLSGRGPNGWYSEIMEVKYAGDELRFAVAAKLLLEISKRAKRCLVAPGRILVSTASWIYVSCTTPTQE